MIGVIPNFDSSHNLKESRIEMIENLARYGTILKITSEDRTFYTFTSGYQKNNREVRYYSAFAFGRFRVVSFEKTSPYYLATIDLISDTIPLEIERAVQSDSTAITNLRALALNYIDITFSSETVAAKKILVENEKTLNKLVFTIAAYLDAPADIKQSIFQINDFLERVRAVSSLLKAKSDELKDANDLSNLVKKGIDKEINYKMSLRSNSSNLLDGAPPVANGQSPSGPGEDLAILEQTIKAKQLPEHILLPTMKEFRRLNLSLSLYHYSQLKYYIYFVRLKTMRG